MVSAYIADGYTLSGKIPALANVWPEVRFTYRPALPERVYDYLRQARDSGKAQMGAIVKLLTEHLVSWSVEDEVGNERPITGEVLRRLHAPIIDRLVDAICSYTPAEAEADAKNSGPGCG